LVALHRHIVLVAHRIALVDDLFLLQIGRGDLALDRELGGVELLLLRQLRQLALRQRGVGLRLGELGLRLDCLRIGLLLLRRRIDQQTAGVLLQGRQRALGDHLPER